MVAEKEWATFLHGDTHTFRIDQPLFSKKTNRRFENFNWKDGRGRAGFNAWRSRIEESTSQAESRVEPGRDQQKASGLPAW